MWRRKFLWIVAFLTAISAIILGLLGEPISAPLISVLLSAVGMLTALLSAFSMRKSNLELEESLKASEEIQKSIEALIVWEKEGANSRAGHLSLAPGGSLDVLKSMSKDIPYSLQQISSATLLTPSKLLAILEHLSSEKIIEVQDSSTSSGRRYVRAFNTEALGATE